MRKLFSIGIISAVAITSAQASFSNWFSSFNAGGSYFQKLSCEGQNYSGFSGPAFSLFTGVPINRYVAPEIAIEYNQASGFGNIVIAGLDFKFMKPFATNYLLFAKLGGGISAITTEPGNSQDVEHSAGGLFGAGVGYRFSPTWMATLEFNGAYMAQTSNYHGVTGAVTLGITHFWPWSH